MKLFQIPNPTEFNDLGQFFNRLIEFSLQLIGVFAVISLMLSGYKYIMAGGDEKKTAAAKASIISTIIGTIVVVISYLIVKFVLVDILNVKTSIIGDWLSTN